MGTCGSKAGEAGAEAAPPAYHRPEKGGSSTAKKGAGNKTADRDALLREAQQPHEDTNNEAGAGGKEVLIGEGNSGSNKESRIDDMLAMMAIETQEKTIDSVAKSRAQLEATVEIAEATQEELDRQGEQLSGVSDDLERVDVGVKRATSQFNNFERFHWTKTRKLGKNAEKGFNRAGPPSSATTRSAADKYGVKLPSSKNNKVDEPRRPATIGAPPPRDAKWAAVDSAVDSSKGVAHGLVGRDEAEEAKLAEIKRNDDEINAGIRDIDGLLDTLHGHAATMAEKTKQSNAKLGKIGDDFESVGRGVANVTARAERNVRKYQ